MYNKLNIKCSECNNLGKCIIGLLNNSKNGTLEVTTNKFKKGQVIYQENSIPFDIYTIMQGNVYLSKRINKKTQILRFAKAGDSIGYRAAIVDEHHSTTATAISETYICCIPKELLLEEIKNNPKLCDKIIHFISSDLKQSEDILISFVKHEGLNRVADVLNKVQNFFGLSRNNLLNVTLTRHELASIACLSTESCIRMLSKLKQMEVISLTGRQIKILNPEKLKMLANGID